MYSTSVTGAFGEPSVMPCSGTPASCAAMSVEPGRPFAALPIVGMVELTFEPPPESAIARPMPMPASTTTAPAIASTRGFA